MVRKEKGKFFKNFGIAIIINSLIGLGLTVLLQGGWPGWNPFTYILVGIVSVPIIVIITLLVVLILIAIFGILSGLSE